jgi:regulator of sirC expression with transglutaminase-like and TPR domain
MRARRSRARALCYSYCSNEKSDTRAMPEVTLNRLTALLQQPEEELNLAEAALLFATDEYPALDVDRYLGCLDGFAARVRARLPRGATFEDTVVALNDLLFEEEGFRGNTDDYYDPRNSFLNEVLDRKLGIPITLSIVYMETGRRLGLAFQGVSFPGHFLVKSETTEGDIVFDPFLGGVALSEEDLVERLRLRFGPEQAPRAPLAPLLQTAGKREILLRVLRNLKAIYLAHQDYRRALTALDRMLLIAPDSSEELRERGRLYQQLECFGPALADLRRCLELTPGGTDAAELHASVVELERVVARLH